MGWGRAAAVGVSVTSDAVGRGAAAAVGITVRGGGAIEIIGGAGFAGVVRFIYGVGVDIAIGRGRTAIVVSVSIRRRGPTALGRWRTAVIFIVIPAGW